MLKGKTVLLGVTASIAAYKTCNLARMLTKLGADVYVAMTQNSLNFVHPLTFETLTQHKCLIDSFDRNFEYCVQHVSIAKKSGCSNDRSRYCERYRKDCRRHR